MQTHASHRTSSTSASRSRFRSLRRRLRTVADRPSTGIAPAAFDKVEKNSSHDCDAAMSDESK